MERIGRYTLFEPLGEGGMAKVWVALKDGARDVCVLKQLHVPLQQNSEAAKRFIREANIASQLIHPGIAKIVDAGLEGTRFCLAMELIAGQTVEAMVNQAKEKGGILPLEVTIPIILQSLEALAYAHALHDPDGRRLGIVHRDLSPRNIMLNYAGQVKLIDFGIAKGDVDEYKTAAGVLMGTPYYMSPEQARTLPVDRRSDLYTLGAVFFEMLTGRRLVQAKGRAKILMTVARQLAPPISSVNPNVPETLEPILAKALAKKPDDRYPNAEEFASALRLAAGEAAFTAPDVLGAFLSDLFPEAEAKAAALISRARAYLADAPPIQSTRVAGTHPVMPSPLTAAGADSRTRTGYLDPSHPMPEFGLIDPADRAPQDAGSASSSLSGTRIGSGSYGSITDGQFFDPAASLAARTTFPLTTSPSRLARIAVGVLVLLIATVGGLLFRVTETQSKLPSESIEKLEKAETQIVVAKPRETPPPPPPVLPPPTPPIREVRDGPPPAVGKKGIPKPPPPIAIASPPPSTPTVSSAYAPFRGRLTEVRRSRDRQAAVRLAIDIERAAGRLPKGSEAAEAVRYEIGRIKFMTDVDDMIEALDRSLQALSTAPGSS